ncbi:MAG: hypothetical protein ACI9W6_000190 [Motiliproteus sp.]
MTAGIIIGILEIVKKSPQIDFDLNKKHLATAVTFDRLPD